VHLRQVNPVGGDGSDTPLQKAPARDDCSGAGLAFPPQARIFSHQRPLDILCQRLEGDAKGRSKPSGAWRHTRSATSQPDPQARLATCIQPWILACFIGFRAGRIPIHQAHCYPPPTGEAVDVGKVGFS
jgi:hypothetical protein